MARTHILKGFADINAALWVCHNYPGNNVPDMVALCQQHGQRVSDTANFEACQVIHEWGLAHKQTRSLTAAGEAFYQIWQERRNEAVDLLHGLQYQQWSKLSPEEHPASWAYKMICDILWYTQQVPKAKDFAYLVASQRLANGPAPKRSSNAFSTKSVHDAYDWLLPLRPPVLLGVTSTPQRRTFKDAVFVRRASCSLSLLVMALAYVLRETEQHLGQPWTLGEAEQYQVCAACLIEPELLPFLLEQAVAAYPQFLAVELSSQPKIALLRPVELEDFC